jgi:rhomboid protease GluP
VTACVIVASIVATGLEFLRYGLSPSAEELAKSGGTLPGSLAVNPWWHFVAANFLHVGLLHIALNIGVIAFIGRKVESEVGAGWTTALVVFGALASSVGAIELSGAVSVGASGIGFALMGAAVAVDPRA